MKNKNIIFAVISALMMVSCGDSDSWSIEGSTTFYGRVVITPSSVSNNELISFEIGAWDITTADISVSIGTSTEINGKNIIKSVEYYIDGQKVAESSDKDDLYKVNYKVENLSIGEHEVSAHCVSNLNNYHIEEYIKNAVLTVQ